MGAGVSKEEQLYQAVQNGNHQLVKSLRREGASLEFVDKEGRTPLILACARQDLFDMVITLLNLGANLNAYRPGSNGGFPLHHAAKRGLEKTVILLISRGADPLAINDDGQTALDMARLRGHTSIVRIIEDHVCLFSGTIREVSGPGLLEVLVPQWVTKKVWAVVLPSHQTNQRRAPRHELVIYPSSKVAQPRTTISLWKVDLEEPKWNSTSPVLVIIDRSTKAKLKYLSEVDGDKAQLEKLYLACRGVPDARNQQTQNQVTQSQEDAALQMAINASLQTATSEGVNTNGWGEQTPEAYNGWGAPEQAAQNETGASPSRPPEKTDYVGWAEQGTTGYNGWNSATSTEAGPSIPTEAPTVNSAEERPSAPPLPMEEYMAGPIHYPTIDTSPVSVEYPTSGQEYPQAAKKKEEEKTPGGQCVVCWDAPAQGVCIPCGHLAGCMGCLEEIKGKKWGCPVCRSPIEQVVKVYAV